MIRIPGPAGPPPRFRVGVSACLLGETVRHDGGHRRDRFLTEVLSAYVEWVPVCPEVGIGLGVPRETIRLARSPGGTRLLGTRSGRDLTGAMEAFTRREASRLRGLGLRGYILKKNSPSCGMERVRVHDGDRVPERSGTGHFARGIRVAFPDLPIEEEGRLSDPRLRENFVNRLFAFDRWLRLREAELRPRDLIRFHRDHKLMLLAHSPAAAARLGRLTARAGAEPLPRILDEYEGEFLRALARVASPGRHANALQHLAGHLQGTLSPADRRELGGLIEEYRRGWIPLVTPLVLLRHHLAKLESEWARNQVYLDPYPAQLALRSAV